MKVDVLDKGYIEVVDKPKTTKLWAKTHWK